MPMETIDIVKLQRRNEKSLRVLAFMNAKEGKGQELMNYVLEVVEPTRREDGNIAYVPHFSSNSTDEIMFDEIWESSEAFDKHHQQDYMKNLFPKIESLLDKPLEIRFYTEVILPQ